MAQQVSVIIPAYNEADMIADTIQGVLKIPQVSQVIVVDDGSSDCTADVARSAGAHRVIRMDTQSGKGGALNAAWQLATEDVILLIDADLGASASEGEKLVAPVIADETDMCIAAFGRSRGAADTNSSGSVHLAARSGGAGLVVRVARYGIKKLGGQVMESPLSGQRALKKEIIQKLGGFAPKFGVEVGLTIDALRLGYRVSEVPVAMVHRPSGRDLKGAFHRAVQLADVITTLTRRALKL